MKIAIHTAKHLQERLSFLIMDCDYPASFFSSFPEDINNNVRWQLSVDAIYRLLMCGLIVPGHKRNRSREIGKSVDQIQLKEEYRQYVQSLSVNNPYSIECDDAVWYEWDLCSTELGKTLIIKHHIENYDAPLCEAFIEDIEALFAAAGVPWTATPLIPIHVA